MFFCPLVATLQLVLKSSSSTPKIMLSIVLCAVFPLLILTLVGFTHFVYKWRNPACHGKLPPGSMGFPLIGETIQFFIPNYSMDVPPFLKKRMSRYGSLFKTSLAGRPVIISADADFNHLIFQKEGELVEFWYMDSFAKLLGQQIPGNSTAAAGYVHKYLRNLVMDHFGTGSLQQKLINQVFEMACINLKSWSSQSSIEVKEASTSMIFELTSKQMLSCDSVKFSEKMSKEFNNFLQGLMSFPLNIPGTTFYRCLKKQEKALKMMKTILQERLASPERRHADFLDQLIEGMKDEKFLTEEFIVYIMFGLLLASFETISSSLTLGIKLLTDHPLVLKELMDEHVEVLRSRENVDSAITWTEYKSMTFTSCVVNETLRLANVAPGILRRAIKDIQVKGYTIPAGWTIMVVPSVHHMNPDKFENPLDFNPWRWKDGGLNIMSKNFIAFGGGTRNCAGAEFSKVLMSIFLHVMVTKYRWTNIKGGDIVRSPTLGFKNGFHIKVVEK